MLNSAIPIPLFHAALCTCLHCPAYMRLLIYFRVVSSRNAVSDLSIKFDPLTSTAKSELRPRPLRVPK